MEDSLASMVYNYKHGFSGFAAMLTEDHAHQLAGQSFQSFCSNWNSPSHLLLSHETNQNRFWLNRFNWLKKVQIIPHPTRNNSILHLHGEPTNKKCILQQKQKFKSNQKYFQ
jgi:hypothetical protein